MEREISIILKVRGAAAAKKAVQDVFNQQTTTLVKGFNQQTKKTGERMEKVAKTSKKASTGVQSFTKTLGRGMAALYLYNRAWATFGANFESGMQLERASMQFEMNVGRVVEQLPILRSATRGIVSDFDLLKVANRAFQQGLNPAAMGKTFKMATVAAQRLGLQASDAINTITNAITKQDEGALNTLGIVTKVNQAYKTQSALIAKNGGVMSNAMSIQLRQSLIMQELERRFGGVNRVQDDGLAILERLRASWTNFRAELGITLGSALRPIMQALTGFLDVTTRVLDKLNDTSGFQTFIRGLGMLGIALGSMKLLGTLRSLAGLLGIVSSKGIGKKIGLLASMFSKLGSGLGKVWTKVSRFIPGLGLMTSLISKLTRFIPGLGLAVTALSIAWDPLVSIISKTWTAGKVFFQLLKNFNSGTGMSKVLKEDADALGSLYFLIENTAKLALLFGSALKGIGQGLSTIFSPIVSILETISNMFGRVTDQVKSFMLGIAPFRETAPLAQSGLDSISGFTKGVIESPFKPVKPPSHIIEGMRSSSPFPVSESTQVGQPTMRGMNLDTKDDTSDKLDGIHKELKKQTNRAEVKDQKEEIQNSQNQARGNILLRR